MKNNLKKSLRRKIIDWNNKFPIDYWWRKKYNVPFGSSDHRKMSFIDMFRDYEEQKMMKELFEETPEEKNTDDYSAKQTTVEIDDDFDNLDITKYNS